MKQRSWIARAVIYLEEHIISFVLGAVFGAAVVIARLLE